MTPVRPLERYPASSLLAASAATSAPGRTSSPAGGGFPYSGTRPHPRRAAPGSSPIHSPGLIPGRQPVAGGME